MTERNFKGLLDELFLADGRRQDVMIKGRLPLCHGDRPRGHFEKNCPREDNPKAKTKQVVEEKALAKAISVRETFISGWGLINTFRYHLPCNISRDRESLPVGA